ncbi:hypothetical protein [Endozoicomonas montiporae]|nr:hypothetical protein [Endozoicomonas montiporae]
MAVVRNAEALPMPEDLPISVKIEKHITAQTGEDVSFKFTVSLPRSAGFNEFAFGLWENDHVSAYFFTVNKQLKGILNPEIKKEYPDYAGRLSYIRGVQGQNSSFLFKTFTFVLRNVRPPDSRNYGGNLAYGGFGKVFPAKSTLEVSPGPYVIANPDFTVSEVRHASVFRYLLYLAGLPDGQEPSGNITFSSLEKSKKEIPLFQSLWHGYNMMANETALSLQGFSSHYNETSNELTVIMKNTTETDFGKFFNLELTIRNVSRPLQAQVQLFQRADYRIPDTETVTEMSGTQTVTKMKIIHKTEGNQEKVITKMVNIKTSSKASRLDFELSVITLLFAGLLLM